MPARAERRKKRDGSYTYRVVEADSGRLVRNNAGTPVDGGGHTTMRKAIAQARAINAN